MMRRIVPFLPALLWAVTVWFIGGLHDVRSPVRMAGLDKLAHFTMYGILGLLLGRAWFAEERRIPWLLPLCLVLLIGAADEVRQISLVRRSADMTDWVADAAGAVAGLLVARGFTSPRARRTEE